MSTTTRVNGTAGVASTLYSVVQLKGFFIDTGATLVTGQAGVDQAIEAVVRELQPLMYFVNADVIHVVVDGHAVDADTLQARVRNLGTVNGYVFTGAVASAATALAFS